MILQFGILFAFVALGELIVRLTGWPIPSSIIGMLMLTLSLKLNIIKLRQNRPKNQKRVKFVIN